MGEQEVPNFRMVERHYFRDQVGRGRTQEKPYVPVRSVAKRSEGVGGRNRESVGPGGRANIIDYTGGWYLHDFGLIKDDILPNLSSVQRFI